MTRRPIGASSGGLSTAWMRSQSSSGVTRSNARRAGRATAAPMPPPRRRSKNQFGATLGARPPWVHEDRYQWLWLYAAVEPVSGACVVLFLPHTDSACLDAFLAAFRQ